MAPRATRTFYAPPIVLSLRVGAALIEWQINSPPVEITVTVDPQGHGTPSMRATLVGIALEALACADAV